MSNGFWLGYTIGVLLTLTAVAVAVVLTGRKL